MPDNTLPQQHEHTTHYDGTINWWSWRPGIKPRRAILIGGSVTILALLLASIGIVTLVLGILDSFSAPLQLPGIVSGHIIDTFDNLPRLQIRLHTPGFPTTVTPVVPGAAYSAIHNGDPVLVDYSPRLHFLFALERGGQRYALPGSSKADDLLGSLALLFLGALLLPYPALLVSWGWRDLRPEGGPCTMQAKVVGKRSAVSIADARRTSHPGLLPRFSRSWHGIALDPVDANRAPQVMTFSITPETYRTLEEGTLVEIAYSPHLHYVYTLERV